MAKAALLGPWCDGSRRMFLVKF